MQIEAHLSAANWANAASIRRIPTSYTDEGFINYLGDQGVIKLRRRFRTNDYGSLEPTAEVFVYSHEILERPAAVDLGFWRRKVRDYIDPPPRCFRCERNDYIVKRCAGPTPRCFLCGLSDASIAAVAILQSSQ